MADAPEHYVPPGGLERVPQHSTLEPVYNDAGQRTEGYYAPPKMANADGLYVASEEEPKGEPKRRICGLPKKTAIILGAILLLLIAIGAIVGGVVGSKKKTSDPTSEAVTGTSAPSLSTTSAESSTSIMTSTTSSSAAASSTAAAIALPKGELFNSQRFHTFSTYYGSDSAITRNTTEAAKNERDFYSIIGSFPSGGIVGSVGIVEFQPQFDDQRWHIMKAQAAQVPDPELYASYGKQVALMIITCQRYGQTVRLALEGETPDASLTLVKQDDKQANQFWYTEQIEADIEGEYGRYALKNYQTGDDWHLGMGDVSSFGKINAPLVKGKPSSDVELWQIMPREFLNETEREQWAMVN